MPNWEAYQEAYNRGILPPDKKALYEEALKRGIIPSQREEPLIAADPDIEANVPPMSLGQMGKSALKNIPSSAVETGKALVTPFIHPKETGKALLQIISGGMQKATPAEQKEALNVGSQYEPDFDQFVEGMKERYGGIENIKRTIAKDPVGIATDVASVFVPGGEAIRSVSLPGKAGAITAKAGEILSKTGASLEPLNVLKRTAALPAKLVPTSFVKKAYESSAKFSTVLSKAERDTLVTTALSNNILPTIKGLEKSRNLIDKYNDEVTAIIGTAQKTGQKIPIDDMFKTFDDAKQVILENSGEPLKASKAFDAVEKEIRGAEKKLARTELSPVEAQAKKQRIYRELESQYAKMMLHPPKVEARMLVARNLKQSLETIVPEIKNLNAAEGEMIELNKAIQRTANRIQNRDLLGIGAPIKGTLGGIIGGAIGAGTALAIGMLDTPAIKARLALVINKLKTKGVTLSPSHTAFRLGLLEAGEMEQRANGNKAPLRRITKEE